jgi:hypothetical protein
MERANALIWTRKVGGIARCIERKKIQWPVAFVVIAVFQSSRKYDDPTAWSNNLAAFG